MDTPLFGTKKVKDENGVEKDVKVFLGQEDSHNTPVFVKDPMKRFCTRCHHQSDNDKAQCEKCGTTFDDNKMECPICHKFFDYLVGDDTHDGGKRGCESCWKPPVKQERVQHETTNTGSFD